MGLLKHFRSKSRLKQESPPSKSYANYPPSPQPRRTGRDLTQRLPEKVLTNIFSYVCPHTQDYTYDPCEQSQIGDGCMLCDLRDLSHCAQTCRKWYASAQQQLYTSIRIDAVHYCELEELLAEKRRKAGKGHFRNRSAVEPVEVPNIRLGLLSRTLREQSNLSSQTLFLKIPYMTRETAKGDLARAVAALPNLRYVDLPDGFYSGDPTCLALRQELQARCPDIRKMIYRTGSEEALELLAHRHWQAIETLELTGLSVEPATLRIVLGSLPTLHDLTLSDMPWIDDSVFTPSPGQLPDFPAVQYLKLKHTPNLTAEGLNSWLQAPHIREMLFSLSLDDTGITVQDLHEVLWNASHLSHLAIVETVSKSLSLAAQQLPPLSSISLATLHFEISSADDVHGLQKPAESYYAYLATSLHQNALPALATLYVRDQSFPELLLLPPLPMGVGGTKSNNLSVTGSFQGGGFNQTLEVFSKGIDELEWVFTSITPQNNPSDRRSSVIASGGRPLSAYSAGRGLGPQWAQGGFGGEARKSVIVGNGFGGFLAVPQEEVPRPITSDGASGGSRFGNFGGKGDRSSFLPAPPKLFGEGGHQRRGSKHDLWR
ncbi:Putative F-box domain, leucine-rich repeat domain superfamily, F-box-like domain superfamily [Septoria linicola]|uniref:F-box domain, leucine-rich repeat domain superfamily, F-box-like domain superfamily n=1 Tax=Septoria linicola TaxID=215465 RepID=A0A9Q9AKM5_9PEZI|nr:putative F-box domain, leucine-rich repeat domain superfamily, F-box-like domain superfamily [Septoria linicola]USW51064.1 Putative F-box domain, leucine-rich repeat domain superfamily, F-box-like domain superfamily [Septoria linicola]